MAKQLLILDLDETLVYGNETELGRPVDFCVGPFNVYRRPHLDAFLSAAAEWFELAVWSSASGGYVRGLVEHLFGWPNELKFVWACDRCTRRFHPELLEHVWAKNLDKIRKLGFELDRVVMIDDSSEKLASHYGNHLHVRPFTGDLSDTELRDILPFLESLQKHANLRRVEKRFWRHTLPSV